MSIGKTTELSSVNTSQIVDGAVTSAKIAASAVGASKINSTGITDGYLLTADGSGGVAWEALAAAGADVQEFTSSGSWVKPAGKSAVYVFAIGGGGGGACGGRYSSTCYGAHGGSGGAHASHWFQASHLPGTVTITIGEGGVGKVAPAAASSGVDAQAGADGGNTSFGTALVAFGGAPGPTTDINTLVYRLVMATGRPVMYGRSKESQTDSTPDTTVRALSSFESSAQLNLRSGQGGAVTGGVGYAGLDTQFGAAGGGAGAGCITSTAYAGGAGGRGFGIQYSASASGGSATANGSNAGTAAPGLGNGGGGGGSRITAGTAGSGGNGYLGGGGGGGGAACNQGETLTVRGGNGGNGGAGYVLVISV